MEELEKKKYWIWLSLIKDLGNKRGMKLLEKYKTPEEIYKLDKEKLIKTEKIGEETANKILDIETRKEINKHIKFMKENQIDIITIQDKEYPNILKEIYDPPMSIYIKGNKEILNNTNIFSNIFVGTGGRQVIINNENIIAPHNGHLYFIYAYGMVFYALFMYEFFRIRKNVSLKKSLFEIPIFIGFTINTIVGEQKFIILYLLLYTMTFVNCDKLKEKSENDEQTN